ncbi:MAG: hypothetical protein HFJ27_04465 [Clostridia bacterium]|nr:hypothetical protein [Clostridia bacterium]
MDLNLFNNRKIDNSFPNRKNDLINTFIEELKNALKNIMNEGIDMGPKKYMKK